MEKPKALYTPEDEKFDPISVFSSHKYSLADLTRVREYIHSLIELNMRPHSIDNVDLYRNSDFNLALKKYNRLVLGSCLSEKVKVVLSYETKIHTTSIGYIEEKDDGLIIRLAIDLAKKDLVKINNKPRCGTRPCSDILDCILSTLEHELVHAIIILYKKDDMKKDNSGHTPLFSLLALNIFGIITTQTYIDYDIDLFEGRFELLGKIYRKGSRVKLLTDKSDTIYTITRFPTNPKEFSIVYLKDEDNNTLKVYLAGLKTPDEAGL
jgi:hypothetical protein